MFMPVCPSDSEMRVGIHDGGGGGVKKRQKLLDLAIMFNTEFGVNYAGFNFDGVVNADLRIGHFSTRKENLVVVIAKTRNVAWA